MLLIRGSSSEEMELSWVPDFAPAEFFLHEKSEKRNIIEICFVKCYQCILI